MSAKFLILAASAVLLAACSRQSNSPSAAATAPVSSKPITQDLFDYYVKQKTGSPAAKVDPKLGSVLMQELEQMKAAAAAEENKADAETQEALELQRIELLAHAGAAAAGVFASPSDAELKAEYDGFVAGLPAQEYHVAHILVPTEPVAEVLITKLQGGADFAKLAREQSADDSKVKGGDLGWIAPGKLPVDFTKAAETLKPGKITSRPVHTIYGWHVIKLLEVRAAAPPPFEQVKAQLTANLQQARYKKFLESALVIAKK